MLSMAESLDQNDREKMKRISFAGGEEKLEPGRLELGGQQVIQWIYRILPRGLEQRENTQRQDKQPNILNIQEGRRQQSYMSTISTPESLHYNNKDMMKRTN